MSRDQLRCPLADRISADFRELVRENCDKCRNGEGRCLIELIFTLRGEIEEDAPRWH